MTACDMKAHTSFGDGYGPIACETPPDLATQYLGRKRGEPISLFRRGKLVSQHFLVEQMQARELSLRTGLQALSKLPVGAWSCRQDLRRITDGRTNLSLEFDAGSGLGTACECAALSVQMRKAAVGGQAFSWAPVCEGPHGRERVS